MPTPFICVMHVGKRKNIERSLNKSIAKSAAELKPGTVYGTGNTPTIAREDARRKANAARKLRAA